MKEDIHREISAAAIKISPPAAVTAGYFAGLTITDWVWIITGAYMLLQIVYLIWRWHRDIKIERERKNDRPA